MRLDSAPAAPSEHDFAQRVDALCELPQRTAALIELLHEAHPAFQQRSTAATDRMRGWILLALARQPIADAAMVFVLEELDTGRTPYLVACAARALRSAPSPAATMVRFVLNAAANIRDADDYVDLDHFGGLQTGDNSTTAFAELMVTLRWLGAHANGAVGELQALLASTDHPLSPEQAQELTHSLDRIREAGDESSPCCSIPESWTGFRKRLQRSPADLSAISFEDQDGTRVRYADFFHGQPVVVVFFYTRCANAGKCSLTVAKLARVQAMLAAAGMVGRIRTAAITYDAEYDLPQRLRGYAESRGVRMDVNHRVLRAVAGGAELSAHFALGVNFIASVVNRHRIEAFLVDGHGQVVASFERIRWDERQVVAGAVQLAQACPMHANEFAVPVGADAAQAVRRSTGVRTVRSISHHSLSPLLYLAMALLPKCPICGATYLSLSGIVALPQLPGIYWLVPALALVTLVNLGSLWTLARARRDWIGFSLAVAGAAITLGWGVAGDQRPAIAAGIAVTILGSLIGVSRVNRRVLGHDVLERVWNAASTWCARGRHLVR